MYLYPKQWWDIDWENFPLPEPLEAMEQLLNAPWTRLRNMTNKIIKASASYVGYSPRKLRLVANAIKKMEPLKAIEALSNLNKRAVRPIKLVYQQALGNAKNNFKLSLESLKTKSLLIEEGPKGGKKADVHSHGARFDRGVRRKQFAHIKLELETEKETHHGS